VSTKTIVKMTSSEVHHALLRPAILQILRAAGFTHTRPAVLDTVTDLAARYLLLLGSSTAQNALNTHDDYVPTVQDIRLALLEAGALRPQLSVLEEKAKGSQIMNGEEVPFEDLRGIEAFVAWAQGPANKEIRRIAGFDGGAADVGEIAAGLEEQDDYVTGEWFPSCSDPIQICLN
jgi:transcription initiation factor TFIID subunit 3